MKKKGRTLTEEEIKEVIRLYDGEGFERKEIAERVGISYSCVQRLVRAYAKNYKSRPKSEKITYLLVEPKTLNIVEKVNGAELRRRLGVGGSHPLAGYSKCDGLLIAEE